MDRASNYRMSPTSTVSSSTISTSMNFFRLICKWNCYVVKFVLVEIGYLVPTCMNFAYYGFFPGPKNHTKRGTPVTNFGPPNMKLHNQISSKDICLCLIQGISIDPSHVSLVKPLPLTPCNLKLEDETQHIFSKQS